MSNMLETDKLSRALEYCRELESRLPEMLPGVDACILCGKELEKKQRRYCSLACYRAFRKDTNYIAWRQGQTIAREIVKRYYDLQPSNIVHHKDKDCRHNSPSNLVVFASQSDHLKHHHGLEVKPLWEG